MSYGRGGADLVPQVDSETPTVPMGHSLITCSSCRCYVIVKPNAKIPSKCPECRHTQDRIKKKSNKVKQRR